MNTRKILYPIKYCISFFFLYLFLYFADYFEPVISQRLIDSVGNLDVVGRLILVWVVLFVVKRVLQVAQNITVNNYKAEVTRLRQRRITEIIFGIKEDVFRELDTVDVVSRQLDDGMVLDGVYANDVIETLMSAILFVVVFIRLCVLNIPMAVFIVAMIALNGILEYVFPLKDAYKKRNKSLAGLRAALSDVYANRKVVKMHTAEQCETERIGAKVAEFAEADKRKQLLNGYRKVKSTFINDIGVLLIISVGVVAVTRGRYSIGTITMMLLYYEKLRSAAVPILNVAPLLKYVRAAEERVNEVTQLEKEKVEGDITFDRIEKLDLNNLSYSYAGGKEIRYSDISISRGECIGIVGHSGAGKSTLISVLTSLYENYNGMIYINGTQLRAIDKSWYRSRIAYVDQGTSLFDRSIMENVRYAMKDGMVDIGDIAEHINIGEDILERMTSNGLSGGEKQRIVLLREILKQADVIILDEFSSALDDVNQIEAMKLVKQLYKDKIIIMITHDSELLVNCDKVYEMKLC